MKPNSCLFRAVRDVCISQFGVDISESAGVFDRFNTGQGIRAFDMVDAIDTALAPYGVGVSDVYGAIDPCDDINFRYLLRPGGFVSAPAIVYDRQEQHAVACLPGQTMTGNLAIRLERRPV